MMQNGLSRELFEKWCTDRRNGVILAGYFVEGTMAKEIMTHPEEIQTMAGQKLPLKMQVEYMSFSAHVDYRQISGKYIYNTMFYAVSNNSFSHFRICTCHKTSPHCTGSR